MTFLLYSLYVFSILKSKRDFNYQPVVPCAVIIRSAWYTKHVDSGYSLYSIIYPP